MKTLNFKTIALSLLTLFVGSCSNEKQTDLPNNVELVKTYLDAAGKEDIEIMSRLLASDYVNYGPSSRDTLNKAETLERWKWSTNNVFDSIEYDFTGILPINLETGKFRGDWISVWSRVKVYLQEDKGEITVMFNGLYQIHNKKIVESHVFYNESEIAGLLREKDIDRFRLY